jgi:F-type H+-transporting ATPase subunit gamma
MQSLDKIKRRINSIRTTSKITGAMKLVATAKMKKLMNQFKNVNAFYAEFYNIIEDLAKNVPSPSIKNQTQANL